MPKDNMTRSLQDLIDATPDLVAYFRNDTTPPHNRNRPGASPVPAEFTNWRDEQRAWRESAVLFDQSHHMPEMFIKGPDALRLLNGLGINSFANFEPGRPKQFIACNPKGQVIGECILHWLDDGTFELISGMQLQNWVEFNATSGGHDVEIRRDLQTNGDGHERTNFRFGMDGPNAERIFQSVVEGGAPDIPFFRTAKVRIAGIEVLALRHGMAGHKGVELSGPYESGQTVRAALMKAGEQYGLTPAGRLAYFSTPTEGGWMAYPLPAIYSAPELADFRRWLPADGWEGKATLSGSFVSDDIEDYYVTPWDMGVERVLKFDHDFVGRAALEKMAEAPSSTKVTLVWDKADVARIQGSLMGDDVPCKYLELPVAAYGFPQADVVRQGDRIVGRSGFVGYSANERDVLSLACLDRSVAEPGARLTLTWGEPDGGTRKPMVEAHRQTEVQVTVAPAPYAAAVRKMKREKMTTAA